MNIFRKFELQNCTKFKFPIEYLLDWISIAFDNSKDISNCLVRNKTWLPLKRNSRLVKSEIQFGHAGKYDR